MSTDRERLRAAYEATAYRVDEGPRGRFTIRVGVRSEDVDALLTAAGSECWAFITAVNPRSVLLPDAENAARMDRLTDAVARRGLPLYRGVGSGAGWPPEPSLLVIGLDEAAAVALAREFDQHAIVVGRRGEPARLVWSAGDAA